MADKILQVQPPRPAHGIANLDDELQAVSFPPTTSTTMSSPTFLSIASAPSFLSPNTNVAAHALDKQDRFKKLCQKLGKLTTTLFVSDFACKQLKEFNCFMSLPAELRSLIWMLASFQERRVVFLTRDSNAIQLRQNICAEKHPTPMVLKICSESRQEGLRYYSACWELKFDQDLAFYTCTLEKLDFKIIRANLGAKEGNRCRKKLIYVNFALDQVHIALWNSAYHFQDPHFKISDNYHTSIIDRLQYIQLLSDDFDVALTDYAIRAYFSNDPLNFDPTLFKGLRSLLVLIWYETDEGEGIRNFSVNIPVTCNVEQDVRKTMADEKTTQSVHDRQVWSYTKSDNTQIEIRLRLFWYGHGDIA